MLTNEIIKSMKAFKGLSTKGIKRKMLECRALSKSFPVKGELPMEMIENQLHDVYEYIKSTIISVRAIIKDDSEASKYMTAKNAIMHGMKGIVENKHDSLILYSICEAYVEANANNTDSDLVIPTYEECLKVYESKFMNQKLWNYNGGNFMTQPK